MFLPIFIHSPQFFSPNYSSLFLFALISSHSPYTPTSYIISPTYFHSSYFLSSNFPSFATWPLTHFSHFSSTYFSLLLIIYLTLVSLTSSTSLASLIIFPSSHFLIVVKLSLPLFISLFQLPLTSHTSPSLTFPSHTSPAPSRYPHFP